MKRKTKTASVKVSTDCNPVKRRGMRRPKSHNSKEQTAKATPKAKFNVKHTPPTVMTRGTAAGPKRVPTMLTTPPPLVAREAGVALVNVGAANSSIDNLSVSIRVAEEDSAQSR